jgi:hypothetical protein
LWIFLTRAKVGATLTGATAPRHPLIPSHRVVLVVAEHGKGIPTVDHLPLFSNEPFDLGKHTVAYEARYLKQLFLRVM